MYEETDYYGYYESPIGWIEVFGSKEAITAVEFVDEPRSEPSKIACVRFALVQLSEYFQGNRQVFDLPLDFKGTDFQRRVWDQLKEISFGQTTSYKNIAAKIGRPKAFRAVGAANGRNPISIIVPCHRVIGSDGRLTGYGGGIWRKEWLLKHEGHPFF